MTTVTQAAAKPTAEIRAALIDELMDRYVDWREQCIALRNAYERWSDAPVLNGAAIVFCSAVVWLVAGLLGPREVRGHLRGLDTVLTLGSLLVQLAAAVAGGLVGRSMVLRGQVPEPDSIPPEA